MRGRCEPVVQRMDELIYESVADAVNCSGTERTSSSFSPQFLSPFVDVVMARLNCCSWLSIPDSGRLEAGQGSPC